MGREYVRYWIYWNDLVQGPFEVEELRTLRAFTADLPVCEENQQDWTPAAAIPELLPYFQPQVEAYAAASNQPAPVPPPPPPEPPVLSPLQGEFFNESTKQQALFDLNGSKQFMFRPVQDETVRPPEATLPPFTSPFRFFAITLTPAVESLPMPVTLPQPPSESRLPFRLSLRLCPSSNRTCPVKPSWVFWSRKIRRFKNPCRAWSCPRSRRLRR